MWRLTISARRGPRRCVLKQPLLALEIFEVAVTVLKCLVRLVPLCEQRCDGHVQEAKRAMRSARAAAAPMRACVNGNPDMFVSDPALPFDSSCVACLSVRGLEATVSHDLRDAGGVAA